MRKQGRSRGKQGKSEAAKQEGTGKEAAGLGKGQGRKAMDHGSIGAGKKRGRSEKEAQEQERTWELLNGRTGEGKNQAGNLQKRQNLGRSGKEWETSGEGAWTKLERNQQGFGRARKEPGRDGEGPEK